MNLGSGNLGRGKERRISTIAPQSSAPADSVWWVDRELSNKLPVCLPDIIWPRPGGGPDLEREQAYLGPIAMCDAQRHMQALHHLPQGCRCLAGMPDLHMHEDGCHSGLWHRAKVITA